MNTLIKAYSLLKRVDDAMEVWREMTEERAVEPTVYSIGCTVHALVLNDRQAQAEQLVEDWRPRVPPNSVVYSTLIKGYARAKDAQGALAVLAKLKRDGCAATLVTYNSVIDACCRGGELRTARRVYDEMQAVGVAHDQVTYSTMVKGFCRHGDLDGALQLQERMASLDFETDLVTYNMLMDLAAQLGRYSLSDDLFDRMRRAGQWPNQHTLCARIHRHGLAGDLWQAGDLLQTFPARFDFVASAATHTCYLCLCLQSGSPTAALAEFERMRRDGPQPDGLAYGKLVVGMLRFGKLEAAAALVRDAYGVRGYGGVAPRGSSLTLELALLERVLRALPERQALSLAAQLAESAPGLSEAALVAAARDQATARDQTAEEDALSQEQPGDTKVWTPSLRPFSPPDPLQAELDADELACEAELPDDDAEAWRVAEEDDACGRPVGQRGARGSKGGGKGMDDRQSKAAGKRRKSKEAEREEWKADKKGTRAWKKSSGKGRDMAWVPKFADEGAETVALVLEDVPKVPAAETAPPCGAGTRVPPPRVPPPPPPRAAAVQSFDFARVQLRGGGEAGGWNPWDSWTRA